MIFQLELHKRGYRAVTEAFRVVVSHPADTGREKD